MGSVMFGIVDNSSHRSRAVGVRYCMASSASGILSELHVKKAFVAFHQQCATSSTASPSLMCIFGMLTLMFNSFACDFSFSSCSFIALASSVSVVVVAVVGVLCGVPGFVHLDSSVLCALSKAPSFLLYASFSWLFAVEISGTVYSMWSPSEKHTVSRSPWCCNILQSLIWPLYHFLSIFVVISLPSMLSPWCAS